MNLMQSVHLGWSSRKLCEILIFLELTLNDAKLKSRMGGRRANLAGFLELKSWYGINRNMSRNVAYNPTGPLNGPLNGP